MDLKVLVVSADEKGAEEFRARHTNRYFGYFREFAILVNPIPYKSVFRLASNNLIDYSVVGICHADVLFNPGSLEVFYESAMAGNLCGIMGRDLLGTRRICSVNPGMVSVLDCCAVFMRYDLPIYFDTKNFDSFHGWAEDLSLQAHAKKIPVVVPSANAVHLGTGREQTWGEYWKYHDRLRAKWGGRIIEPVL
jgi:hypothetical protein